MGALRIALVVLLLLGIAAAGGAYSVGKKSVVEGLIEASRRDDAQAFDDRIDWETLRENLKEGIAGQKKGMGTFAGNIGPELSQIPAIVDHYIQLRNIPALFYYHGQIFKDVKEEAFIESTGFAAPYGFYVTLAYPLGATQGGDMAAAMRQRLKVRVVFGLSGLTWKIRDMHVPLYMVPTQATPIPDDVLKKK